MFDLARYTLATYLLAQYDVISNRSSVKISFSLFTIYVLTCSIFGQQQYDHNSRRTMDQNVEETGSLPTGTQR